MAHRIHADRDDAVCSAGGDSIDRLRHALEAARAVAADRVSDLVARNAGSQRDDSADVRGIDRTGHVAADQLIDVGRIKIRAVEQFSHDQAAQLLRGKLMEQTSGFHEWRSHASDDDGLWHGALTGGDVIKPLRDSRSDFEHGSYQVG